MRPLDFHPCTQEAEESDLRWQLAILVSLAIAISYLDRQSLPVAVQSISRDIPLTNSQFSALQSAFLFSYALMYAEPVEGSRSSCCSGRWPRPATLWRPASHCSRPAAFCWEWARVAGFRLPHAQFQSSSRPTNEQRRWGSSMPEPRWER